MLKPIRHKGQARLSNFYNKVKKIAKSRKEDYFSVRVEFNSKNGLEYTAYINGMEHVSGKTMAEVIEGLENYGKSLEPNTEDVIIDKK